MMMTMSNFVIARRTISKYRLKNDRILPLFTSSRLFTVKSNRSSMEVVVKAKGGEKTKYHVFVQCFPGLEETLMDDIKKIRTKGGKVEIRRGGEGVEKEGEVGRRSDCLTLLLLRF